MNSITKLFKRYYGSWILLVIILILSIWFLRTGNSTTRGYLVSFISPLIGILGVFWQVNKQIQNSKHLELKKARPVFTFDIMDGGEQKIGHSPSVINTKSLSEVPDNQIYLSAECLKLCGRDVSWIDKDKQYNFVQLQNLSDNPMLMVKLVMRWDRNDEDNFWVNKIAANQNVTFIHHETYVFNEQRSIRKKTLDKLQNIELYFLTNQNEKNYLRFSVRSGFDPIKLEERKTDQKDEQFFKNNYPIDNIFQSVSLDNLKKKLKKLK